MLGQPPVPNPLGQVTMADVNSVRSLRWLDQIKGVALLWIMLIHGVERIFKPPLFSNPTLNWPALADRIAQVQPLDGFGWANLPLNLLRYVGWLGDQGVQLFLIASGFGLTWSVLQRSPRSFSWQKFYQRRLWRLYPLWWLCHIVFLGFLTIANRSQEAAWQDPQFYLSFLGWRWTLDTFYYLSPSWWFFGLLLQLYLLFPLLWQGLQRWGALWLFFGVCAVALPVRAIGLFTAGQYVELWSRGNFCLTRLPEFVLGMSLAAWFDARPEETDRVLRSWQTQLAAGVVYGMGLITAFTLWGMTVSPLLLGAGALVLIYGVLPRFGEGLGQHLAWWGRHSYALFLVHQVFFKALMPFDEVSVRSFVRLAIALLLSVMTALLLEQSLIGLGRLRGKLIKT
jgi:peptidoglycan/LPS O-acetylase OafA/YrhL